MSTNPLTSPDLACHPGAPRLDRERRLGGTLSQPWASHKSFKPKDGPRPPSEPSAGRNAEVQWHGQKRSNDTHASTTDLEARLYRKSSNTAATLCYSGHLLNETVPA